MVIVRPFQDLFGDDGSSVPTDDKNSAASNIGLAGGYPSLSGLDLPQMWDIYKKTHYASQSGGVSDSFLSDTGGYGYTLSDFFKGLLASQGAENKINREYNSAEAALNREWQSNEAALQRQWYEEMSNSAYSRSVADMKRAGINPILAYQQGGAASASTGVPTGSAASYGVTGGDTISSLINGIANLISSIGSASSDKYKAALALLKGLI